MARFTRTWARGSLLVPALLSVATAISSATGLAHLGPEPTRHVSRGELHGTPLSWGSRERSADVFRRPLRALNG